MGSSPSGQCLDDPDPGPLLGARLGEQQGPTVVEDPAGEAAPGLGGLLLVGLEPAALHQVDDEGGRLEHEGQVLAPLADPQQRRAVGDVRGRGVGLQRGERDGHELRQHGPAELVGEPLGVGPDLGQLRHRPAPRRGGPGCRGARSAGRWRRGPSGGRRSGPRRRSARPRRWRRPSPGPGLKVTSGASARPGEHPDALGAEVDVPRDLAVAGHDLLDRRSARRSPGAPAPPRRGRRPTRARSGPAVHDTAPYGDGSTCAGGGCGWPTRRWPGTSGWRSC